MKSLNMKSLKLKKTELKLYNKKEIEKEINYDVVKSIAYKALKVASCNSRGVNMQALIICERYMNAKNDDWNDATQDVALACLENGYKINNKIVIKSHSFKLKNSQKKFNFISKISKKCIYRSINKLLNIALHSSKNISIDSYINEKQEYIEKVSYNEFLTNYSNSYDKKSIKKTSIDLNNLNLTNRQLEILKMYAKTGSIVQVAELLDISKQAVSKTINIIRKKLSEKVAI